MVLAAAGGVNHDKLVDIAKEHFGTTTVESKEWVSPEPCQYTGSEVSNENNN